MKALFLSAITACAVLGYSSTVRAQEGGADFVPAQMTTTPNLVVPTEAIQSGLGGEVSVEVSIDAAGNVTSAHDVVGPGNVCRQIERPDVIAMRNAAKEAVLLAKFTPATKKGVPVASTIWLNFKFPGKEAISDYKYTAKSEAPKTDVEKSVVKSTIPSDAAAAPPPDTSQSLKSDGTPPRIPKQINGGVLNGKATSLPKPSYPPAAHAVRAGGTVSVQVLIDEDGNVFAAQAIVGHPLLRSASTVAACKSKFSPTRLAGNPVKVMGVVTYNFVP
jgi:hypothetical protein